MATAIKLNAQDVLEISVIDHNNPYKKGKRSEDKKTFSRYRYDGKVFTVDSENPFVQDFANGKVRTVKLISDTITESGVDDDGNETTTTRDVLSFDSYVSRAAYNAMLEDSAIEAKIESKIAVYRKLETAELSAELLQQLENA